MICPPCAEARHTECESVNCPCQHRPINEQGRPEPPARLGRHIAHDRPVLKPEAGLKLTPALLHPADRDRRYR